MSEQQEKLLAKAKDGDHAALGELLQELRPVWLAHARKRMPGHEHTAEDLVSSMIVRLLSAPKSAEAYADVDHLLSFGHKVMRNIHVDDTRNHFSLKRGGSIPHLTINTRSYDDDANTDIEDRSSLSPVDEAINREQKALIAKGLSERQQSLLSAQMDGQESRAEHTERGLRTHQRDWSSIRRRTEEVLELPSNSINTRDKRQR